MRVTLRHHQRPMTECLSDLGKRRSIHREVTRGRVPQIVESAVLTAGQSRGLSYCSPRELDVGGRIVPHALEDPIAPGGVAIELRLNHLLCRANQGNVAGLAVLRLLEAQGPTFEV